MDGYFFGKNKEMNASKIKKGLAFAKPFLGFYYTRQT